MARTNAAKALEVGHLVPPRVHPRGYEMLVVLFEALEESAPDAIESLRRDVLQPTLERLGPIGTDTEIPGRWSGPLEQWKRRYHLNAWDDHHHAETFDSVMHFALFGLEITRQIDIASAWPNWRDKMGVALSPGAVAFSEWRLLKDVDSELVKRLTIPPPVLKVWNPVLESWSTWRQRAHREIADYRRIVEDTFRQEGAKPRSVKHKAREHFGWLSRYQVREEDFGSIAETIEQEPGQPGGDAEARVRKAVQLTARLIGLTLRRGPGRPPSSGHK